tara:strand:- start:6 stop:464 length:459 start_codon:yes stop_codon:yes gene_type:complete
MFKIIFIIILILFDITIKQLVFHSIDLYKFIYITSFLDITHIHNLGISFGLFSDKFHPFVFILIGIVITIFIFILFLNSKQLLEKWAYALILAGAIGNIVDRSINGFVIDFIYLHYKDFYWPAFNLADIYISIGIFIIVLQIFDDIRKREIN